MSLIGMMEARLPPGFRFHPRDDELVLDYLCHKLSGGHGGGVDMVDVDLNKCEPWELPDAACVGGGREWYFFSLHDRKYATGQRTNRATRSGYWKATGKDRAITGHGGGGGAAAVVGMRKTLVFYQGRAPRGTKTEWVMHEFRVEECRLQAVQLAGHADGSSRSLKEDWVLCRVFDKSRTAAPRTASDEAGSLNSDLGAAPTLLPEAPVFGRAPMAATIDGWYGQQEYSTGLLPVAHHRPALPLPFNSFRDLLSDMVEGSSGPKVEFLDQGWSDDGYARQSGLPQTWNPF